MMRVSTPAACAIGLLMCLSSAVHAQTADTQLPDGEGKPLVSTLCTACHTLDPILMKRDGPVGWRATVDNMVMRGSSLFLPGEPDIITQYLARSFGPGPSRMQTGVLPPGAVVSQGGATTSKDVVLPAGAGKELVEQRCGAMCHDLGRVVSARRTRDEWARIVRNMSERGLLGGPEQIQTIVSYLTGQFGREVAK
jgi:cytochrome c5